MNIEYREQSSSSCGTVNLQVVYIHERMVQALGTGHESRAERQKFEPRLPSTQLFYQYRLPCNLSVLALILPIISPVMSTN